MDQTSISNYAAFANNPITITDVAGNTPALVLAPEVIGGLIITAGVLSYMYQKYSSTGTIDWSGAVTEAKRSWNKWNATPDVGLYTLPTVDALYVNPVQLPVIDVKTIPKVQVIPQEKVKSETKRAFYHITYQMTDANNNVYVGRTSGYGTPMELAKQRASGHHATKRGFMAETVIPTMAAESLTNSYESRDLDPAYYFIRGAEDALIKENIKQEKSGNKIMGISEKNKKKDAYRNVYIANDNSARELDNCTNCGKTKESVPLIPN